jgi:hypothetical protein
VLRHWIKVSLAAFYTAGGPLIHIYCITQRPQIYTAIDDHASALYAFIWNALVLSHLLGLVALLIILEFVAGLYMFSDHPRLHQLGQMAGLLFNLGLIPFWFAYGVPNLLLATVHLWLFMHETHGADLTSVPLQVAHE